MEVVGVQCLPLLASHAANSRSTPGGRAMRMSRIGAAGSGSRRRASARSDPARAAATRRCLGRSGRSRRGCPRCDRGARRPGRTDGRPRRRFREPARAACGSTRHRSSRVVVTNVIAGPMSMPESDEDPRRQHRPDELEIRPRHRPDTGHDRQDLVAGLLPRHLRVESLERRDHPLEVRDDDAVAYRRTLEHLDAAAARQPMDVSPTERLGRLRPSLRHRRRVRSGALPALTGRCTRLPRR